MEVDLEISSFLLLYLGDWNHLTIGHVFKENDFRGRNHER